MMAILGILTNDFWLLIIAVFVWIGANAEMQAVSLKQTLRPVHYDKIINAKPKTFPADLNLEEAFEKMEDKNQAETLVELQHGFGFVNVEMIAKVKRINWFDTKLADIAARLPIMPSSTPADKLLQAMAQTGIPFIEIVKNREFAGIISEKDLSKLYRLHKLDKDS